MPGGGGSSTAISARLEREQGTAVAGRAFGKDRDGAAALERGADLGDLFADLHPVAARDEDRAVERAQPADQRHTRAAPHLATNALPVAPGQHQYVDPAEVVGDEEHAWSERAVPVTCRRAPTIQAIAPRKRGGQGEAQPTAATGRGGRGSQQRQRSSPATAARCGRSRPRSYARALRRPRPQLAVEADAVQLHAVIDEAEAQLLGDLLLQLLEFGIDEFDDAGQSRRRSDDRDALRARARSARGRRRNRAGRGCRLPRTAGPCGTRSRSRCPDRSPRRGRGPSRRRDDPRLRTARGRSPCAVR